MNNRLVATLAQRTGRFTVIIALIYLIWNAVDFTTEFAGGGFGTRSWINIYIQIISTASTIAVSGMLALGIGMMLERFNDE